MKFHNHQYPEITYFINHTAGDNFVFNTSKRFAKKSYPKRFSQSELNTSNNSSVLGRFFYKNSLKDINPFLNVSSDYNVFAFRGRVGVLFPLLAIKLGRSQ